MKNTTNVSLMVAENVAETAKRYRNLNLGD